MRSILKLFIVTLLFIPLTWANAQNYEGFANEPGEVFYLNAKVIDYQPAYSFVEAGRNSKCQSNRSSHKKHSKNGTGGTIIGALLGAAVGSQIGDGSGRNVAIIGGAVAGGVIGNNVATRDKHDDNYSCRQRNGRIEEQRLSGYDVNYLFHRQRHVVRTLYEPGNNLRLLVEVYAEE